MQTYLLSGYLWMKRFTTFSSLPNSNSLAAILVKNVETSLFEIGCKHGAPLGYLGLKSNKISNIKRRRIKRDRQTCSGISRNISWGWQTEYSKAITEFHEFYRAVAYSLVENYLRELKNLLLILLVNIYTDRTC